jgi:hypothetical protein
MAATATPSRTTCSGTFVPDILAVRDTQQTLCVCCEP